MQLTDLYRPIIGGVESYVETLSKELVRLGHSVVVVTMQPGEFPEEEIIDGVHVFRIRSWSQNLSRFYADTTHPFHPPIADPGVVAALRRIIRQEQPDVVHSHSWFNHSFFPLYHAHKGPAHVLTLHDYGMACPRKTLLQAGHDETCSGPKMVKCLSCAPEQYGILKGSAIAMAMTAGRTIQHRIDRYLAVSESVAEGSRPILPPDAKITQHAPLIPDDLMQIAQETPRPDFLPAEDGFLMFAGALGLHKGVAILLAAHRKMRHKVPLVLLGMPRSDTPSIDHPDITVVHNVPNAQVMASWMRASIAVVPSIWHEALGF